MLNSVLFINPSTNMNIISREIAEHGLKLKYAYTKDMPVSNADTVFYISNDSVVKFSTTSHTSKISESKLFLLKRGIFSNFKMRDFYKQIQKKYPKYSHALFSDDIMAKRGSIKSEKIDQPINTSFFEYKTIQEAVDRNPNDLKFSNKLFDVGSESLIYWETDYDLMHSFRDAYFILFSKNARLEAFVCQKENKLITIGLGDEGVHLSILYSLIPTIKRFSIKSIKIRKIARNINPWLEKVDYKRFTIDYLINDYSFSSASISMPTLWYHKVAEYIAKLSKYY